MSSLTKKIDGIQEQQNKYEKPITEMKNKVAETLGNGQ